MELRNQARGSGKSSAIIRRLRDNPLTYMAIVPRDKIRKMIYPEDVQEQVVTFNELLKQHYLIPKEIQKVFLDDPFLSATEAIQVSYMLGEMGVSVEVYYSDPETYSSDDWFDLHTRSIQRRLLS